MIDEKQIDRWFSSPELDHRQKQAYMEILDAAHKYIVTVNRWMPDGEDKMQIVNSVRQGIITAELAIRYRGVDSPISLVQ